MVKLHAVWKVKASSKFLYSAPFAIADTSTIYTYAMKNGRSSPTNVVKITRGHVLTFVEAASAEGIEAFAMGGDVEWTAAEDVNAKVGNASVRSGAIDDDQVSWFTAEVEGLTYTLFEGRELKSLSLGDSKLGDGSQWTPTITVSGGDAGFYSIDVSK